MDDIERLRIRSIVQLEDAKAFDHLALLIDASGDAGFVRGAERALHLLDDLSKRNLVPKHGALLEYFRANAWSIKSESFDKKNAGAWEHDTREQGILALSRAAIHQGFVELSPTVRCQILTNRANQLLAVGRVIDAIAGYDQALGINPDFALAQANRAQAIKTYRSLLCDDSERASFLLCAHDGWSAAIATTAVYDSVYPDSVKQRFASEVQRCAAAGDLNRIRDFLRNRAAPSLGRSKQERNYRQWCLQQRLFLNPLNDLGLHPSGAFDTLVLPAITENFNDRPNCVSPPSVIGFFNQLKQEFVSARFMLYEGLLERRPHFSDRGVVVFDTLDYPAYSLAIERVRAAYRIGYSLLDKVAFLINHYWKLEKAVDRINFKNIWMGENKRNLFDGFENYQNWPLRGLYWLSKELFDDQLKQTTGPDARELHDIRNTLEHKYLHVNESWANSVVPMTANSEGLGVSIGSELLKAKTLRVLKMARSALIQLSLAISVEEDARKEGQPKQLVFPMPLFELEDRHKNLDSL